MIFQTRLPPFPMTLRKTEPTFTIHQFPNVRPAVLRYSLLCQKLGPSLR